MIDFKGSHFEREIVLWGVRWYVAYLMALSRQPGLAARSHTGNSDGMKPPPDADYRHRFPAEIIRHAVWLYHVFMFSLSLPDVELLLAVTVFRRTCSDVPQDRSASSRDGLLPAHERGQSLALKKSPPFRWSSSLPQWIVLCVSE